MSNDYEELDFTIVEEMGTYPNDVDTCLYQFEDGTIFYCSFKWENSRIYVKYEGEEIDADLSQIKLFTFDRMKVIAHENTLFFNCGGKFYKATFTPSEGITITYVRDKVEGESLLARGMIQRIRGDAATWFSDSTEKLFAYRFWEDPNNGGLEYYRGDTQAGYGQMAMHRGKLIRVKTDKDLSQARVVEMTRHMIRIAVPCDDDKLSIFADDHSPFFYIECHGFLYTFWTETMGFLKPLRSEGYYAAIVSVYDGVITMVGYSHDNYNPPIDESPEDGSILYVINAELPDGYY